MDPGFWISRWQEGRIGFHQAAPNPKLQRFSSVWEGARRILVPLSGKSLDVLWLRDHTRAEVVAVEVAPQAVEAFHQEHNLTPTVERRGPFELYRCGRITTYLGDFMNLPEVEPAGAFDAVYDRAALIALPPELRAPYARTVTELAAPGARALTLTLEYPQAQMSGPPFAVERAEMESLWQRHWDMELREAEEALDRSPRFASAGITSLRECTYTLVRRA